MADATRWCIPPIGAWSSAVPLPGTDGGMRSTPPTPNYGGWHAQWAREVEDATEDMRRRVLSFPMVYMSPVHGREHSGELAHSAFLADSQRRGGGATGAVVTDAAAQTQRVGMLWFVTTCPDSIGHLCIRWQPKKSMWEHFGSSVPFRTLREQSSKSRWN